MKYRIEDLSSGKCAVRNDGTLEELKEVLSRAFPEDGATGDMEENDTVVQSPMFKKHSVEKGEWDYKAPYDVQSEWNLPTQSVKDFLVEEWVPEVGEMVEVRDTASDGWCEREYLCTVPCYEVENRFVCRSSYTRSHTARWPEMRQLDKPKVLDVTMEDVIEKFGCEVKIVEK